MGYTLRIWPIIEVLALLASIYIVNILLLSLYWDSFSNFIDNTKRVPEITNVVEQNFF